MRKELAFSQHSRWGLLTHRETWRVKRPGAGEVFAWGPAPRNRHTRIPVAQVSTLFPHLRQRHLTPAPTKPYTCTTDTLHLRQRSPTPKSHTYAGDEGTGEVTICKGIAVNGVRFRQNGGGRDTESHGWRGFGERLKGEGMGKGGVRVAIFAKKVAIIEYFYYFWQSSSVLCA